MTPKPKFKLHDNIIINEYIGTDNEDGRILSEPEFYCGEWRYYVSNMNMPYMGTISEMCMESELSFP